MFKKHTVLQLIVILLVLIQTSVGLGVAIAKNSLDPISNVGVISAAYKDNGDLRLVNGPDDIKKNETFISWNQQGIAGPQGSAGPIGLTGATGATGAAGATGSFNATQWQQVLNNTGNASAHYALTSAHGVSGNIVGTNGFQNVSFGSVNTTGNFTGANTFKDSIKLVGANLSSGNPLQFVYRGDTVVDVKGAGSAGLARLAVSDLQIASPNGIYFSATGAGFQASVYGSNNSYSHISVYNGTQSSEIMRFVQYLGNQWAQFTKPPKFSTNSVTGPSNNVTPVTWIPILLADNTTAFLPAYK
mgnify:CR=1 FL=1